MIDTLRTARMLEASGFTVAQAEVVATILGSVSRPASEAAGDVRGASRHVPSPADVRADLARLKRDVLGWWLLTQIMVAGACADGLRFDVFR